MKITIGTVQALTLLREHKQNHIDTYEETVEGWKRALAAFTVELNQWAQQGGEQGERPSEPRKPKDYTEDYDRLIDLLEHHILVSIALDEHEYDEIVKDKFNWSNTFQATTAFYSGN